MPRYPQTVLASCEIPWDEHEQLLEDVFRQEVRMVLAMGFQHLYVFGTAGEGYAVDSARFRQIVEIFRDETSGAEVYPQIGVIGLSTATIIERIALAHALAKRVLGGADYRRIADAVPNLAATKNTGGGAQRAADLMRHAPDLQHFFGEDNFMAGSMFGECSLLASLGPLAPRRAWEYLAAGRDLQLDRLLTLHHAFLCLLYDVLGPLLAKERIDGAYDKVIVRLGGLEAMPLRLLSPYQGFDEHEYQQCRRIFDQRYAAWAGA
jgi:dihydrodipicolinate synthase/N-acetylneuraminate lyase